MKRITAILCAIIMCAVIVCPFALTAFAESTAYEIDALNMSIPIPDDMIVLTRDSTANDEFFKTFKLNYDTTMSKLTEGNIYLESVTKDSSLTLTVTMTKTEDSKKIGSYNSLSDEEIANIMQKLRENKTYKDASPVEYNDIKYICLNMSFKSGKKTVQAQQYNTVMNGENINITMQAAPGKKLKAADKEMLAQIVSGVTILNDNFFNRNKGFILYGSITLAGIAIIIVVFVILLKYFRNPDRKHKILVHELAHEHKITETTQIPKKHIFNVTKPTNTFLTKYAPIGEKGKRKKKKAEVIPEESREIKSYSEPVPEEATVEEEPVTKVEYNDAADEIEVPVETSPAEVLADEIAEEIKAEAQPEPEVEEQPEVEAEPETIEEPEVETEPEKIEEPEAQAEPQAEEAEKAEQPEQAEEAGEMVDISETEEPEAPAQEVEEKPQKAVQSDEEFDATADYFDVDPDEGEMFSYTDVETAVDDYSKAKRGLDVNEDEDYEDIPNAWDTVKKVLAAIGRGIATVFRAIFVAIVFAVTHLKYFIINLSRMIRRKHAQNKRRKIEEQRRRDASERRRMEREAERARRRNNQNRGSNDLVQVRSSYERGSAPRPSSRERIDRDRRNYDRRRPPQDRSSRPRR